MMMTRIMMMIAVTHDDNDSWNGDKFYDDDKHFDDNDLYLPHSFHAPLHSSRLFHPLNN